MTGLFLNSLLQCLIEYDDKKLEGFILVKDTPLPSTTHFLVCIYLPSLLIVFLLKS